MPVVALGASFDGARAEHRRGCAPPPPERISEKLAGPDTRVNMQMVAYPDCDPSSGSDEPEGGCLPPQVRTWPACERNLAMYETTRGPTGR